MHNVGSTRAFALLGLLAACEERLSITGPIPTDTRYVAAILYDGDGDVITGTPLAIHRAGAAVEVQSFGQGAEVVRAALYAWADGAIPAETLFAKDDSPLELAEPMDPVLPAPTFYGIGTGVGGRFGIEPLTEAPPLTAPWVPACSRIIEDGSRVYYDARCVPRRCLAEPPVQVGCRLRQELGVCGLGPVEMGIDGRGALHPLSDYARANCEQVEAPDDARVSFRCAGCRVDVYVEPAALPLAPFEQAELELYPGLPVLDFPVTPTFVGYLSDMFVFGDRLVVSSYGGAGSPTGCARSTRTSRLHFFDLGTLGLVGTATVAGCVDRIAPDPTGPGLFGLDADAGRLLRFDDRGRALERTPIAVAADQLATDLTAFTDPPRLWMGLRGLTDVASSATLFDATTMRPIVEIPSEARLRNLIPGPSGTVVGGYGGVLDFFGVADGRNVGTVALGTGAGIGNEPHALVYLPAVERYLSIDGGDRTGIHVSTMIETTVATVQFARDGALTGGVAWPPDPRLALIGFTEMAPSFLASVAIFDAEGARFLPDAWPIGLGPVLAMTSDRDGRIFLMLPYSAKVVVLTPR